VWRPEVAWVSFLNLWHANEVRLNMSNWPKLTKAPIVEALIDIRVDRSSSATIEVLKALGDDLAEQFPTRVERRRWTGHVWLQPDASPNLSTSADEVDGVVLRSPDNLWVAQFGFDGFTLSRLSPYLSWEELRVKVEELWTRYEHAARPARIARIGARFINRIPLDQGVDLEKTFRTTFVVSPSLPQGVAGFLLRFLIPFSSEGSNAIVTQSLEGGNADCIFDVDAFSERAEGFSTAEMWDKLNELREIKNRLFFESLTTDATERFR